MWRPLGTIRVPWWIYASPNEMIIGLPIGTVYRNNSSLALLHQSSTNPSIHRADATCGQCTRESRPIGWHKLSQVPSGMANDSQEVIHDVSFDLRWQLSGTAYPQHLRTWMSVIARKADQSQLGPNVTAAESSSWGSTQWPINLNSWMNLQMPVGRPILK